MAVNSLYHLFQQEQEEGDGVGAARNDVAEDKPLESGSDDSDDENSDVRPLL